MPRILEASVQGSPNIPSDMVPLFVERYFSADERRAFIRRWVGFQLDDLNVLGDRLRHLAATHDPQPTAGIAARVDRIVQALGMGPAGTVAEIWRVIEDPIENPTDYWGPIQALATLEPDRRRFTDWLATLAEKPQALACLLDTEMGPESDVEELKAILPRTLRRSGGP